jgi:ATP-dependent exoDNAse (exonuclease V) alpha subunit
MEIILNSDQEKAIQFLKSWWLSPYPFAMLEGAAGTGKTTIIDKVIKELLKAVPLFTAPTNEAVKQMQEKLESGAEVITTYAALGYSMDLSSERKNFIKRRDTSYVENCNLIVVDECSMLPENLVSELLELGRRFQKKVLFLGHRNQLPPVDTELKLSEPAESPAFTLDIPTFTLRKSERAEGELLKYVNHLESLVNARHKIYKKAAWSKSQDELYEYIYSPEGRKRFKKDEAKVIGYTNKEVDGWNYIIRQSIHKKHGQVIDRFLKGDRILLTEPVHYIGEIETLKTRAFDKLLGDSSLEGLAANSRYEIKSVDQTSILGVPCWKLLTADKHILYSVIGVNEFEQLRKQLFSEALAKKSRISRNNAFYKYHQTLALFSNIKHSYAFTAHRSQGMTIPEVWVNWKDIKVCGNVMLRHKLLYVAASRAKETMWMVE